MAFDNSTMESTNRLLHDLERKLSFVSTTSSSQTHQSQQSLQSIVVDRNLEGLGKQNVESLVLQYIRSNGSDNFSANALFEDRQTRFMTRFGKNYNDDSAAHRSTHVFDDEPEEAEIDFAAPEDPGSPENSGQNDLLDAQHGIFYTDPSDDDDLPPSPPRPPPRDLDPDRLYGLYDFLGPDPLHCTLARDEPVFLVNDSDNYWWLIRKLTRDERLVTKRDRNSLYDPETDTALVHSQDGKIGFVPAECLETYGERLARLNCFKNEELEKLSRDLLNDTLNRVQDPMSQTGTEKNPVSMASPGPVARTNDADVLISSPETSLSLQPQLNRSGSIIRDKLNPNNSYINKSVTFEDVGELDMGSDPSDTDQDFADHYYSIPRDEIEPVQDHDEEKRLEVLSDVFPSESPLVINKNPRKKATERDPLVTPVLGDSEKFLTPSFQPPLAPMNSNVDTISIGSFSPDTPPQPRVRRLPSDQTPHPHIDDESLQLRRSVILDRLNQVTFDIQEQLNTHTSEEDFEMNFGPVLNDEKLSDLSDDDVYENYSTTMDQDDTVGNGKDELVTPLTSMNSLNGFVSQKTSVADKRKLKPVHDMFMPILGKFDELAEKLAELDDLL